MALKKNEIEVFRRRLEDLRQKLSQNVKSVSEDVKSAEDPKGYSQHQADEGTDDFGKTISIEVSSKEFDVLRQIDRALLKIEEGTYGVCDISGDEIPKARLDAVPYATMTVDSQEKKEKGLL